MTRKILISLALISILFFVCASYANAQKPGFGGLITIMTPCTCSPGLFLYSFSPLYFTSPVPLAGFLVGPPAVAYPYYSLHPASWALGLDLKGAGICLMGFPPYCFEMPNYGMITPVTGVSGTI